MVKDWDKVWAQVYKYYVEDKMSLPRVMAKMSNEHNFEASERTFRKKLSEWNFKRASETNNHSTDAGPSNKEHSNQFASAASNGIVGVHQDGPDNDLLSYHDMSFFNVGIDHNSHAKNFNNMITAPANNASTAHRDEMFDRVLQGVHDAPSDCPSKDILMPGDFYNKANSTLLHYVAAKGKMSDVLIHILHFCSHHDYAVDCKDSMGYTALHIAVYHDRVENIVPLCAAGARVDMSNSLGELPIHVAIMTSKSPQLLEDLFARHKNGVKAPVNPPSPRAGQVALDLAVERVLLDLSYWDCTQATRSILLEVLKRGEVLENTTYLRVHAEKDQVLFNRAITVVGNVWLGKKLRRIMIDVLSAVNRERTLSTSATRI